MYKHLNEMMRKSHVTRKRRQESILRKRSVEKYGTKFTLKKSVDEMDTQDVLESLQKGAMKDSIYEALESVDLGKQKA